MESQKLVKLVLLSLLVVGCNNTNSSSSLNSSTTSESVSVSSTLSSTSSTSSESSSKNNIDYSLFDNNIIGTWYVHSAAQGVLNLNDVIVISDTYEATVRGIHFSFIGLYEGFEGACLFLSDKGTTQFIASSDEEGFLDWGIMDTQGNQDFGYAKNTEHVSGIQYSYEGTTWPMENIKAFLSTDLDIPVYEHDYYYLFTGTSQLYDDIYCMIDLYGVSRDAIDDYTLELEDAGYVFTSKDITFFTAYDPTNTYTIRLSQSGDNMCIFVYYYSTFYNK